MKNIAILFFLLALTLNIQAQNPLISEFEKALDLTDKAREHAQNTAQNLGFFNGAADLEEIKYHNFEVRSEMDSLYIYTIKAEYKATDIAYAASKLNQKFTQKQADSARELLNTATKSINESRNKLDLIFDELSLENVDIQSNQAIEYFNMANRQLKQAERELKAALKTLK